MSVSGSSSPSKRRLTIAVVAIVALLVVAGSAATAAYVLEHGHNSSRDGSPVVRNHPRPPIQAPLAPPISLGNASNSSSAGVYVYNYSIIDAWGAPIASQVGFEVETFDCAPVSTVTGIEIVGPTGQPLAWELNSSVWGGGGSTTVGDFDTVSFLSSSALIGDEWIMNWTEPGASGEASEVIAGTGPWAGCDYTPDYPLDSNFAAP
jgi:hypothetical protein